MNIWSKLTNTQQKNQMPNWVQLNVIAVDATTMSVKFFRQMLVGNHKMLDARIPC